MDTSIRLAQPPILVEPLKAARLLMKRLLLCSDDHPGDSGRGRRRLVVGARVAADRWTARSPCPGLRAPVEVLIDEHGVPAVYARDAEDALFAAGVLHARDRRGRWSCTAA